MANGYDTFADAMLASINGPADGSYAGERWTPLQCAGCGQWFPVLEKAVDLMACQIIKMTCKDCENSDAR